jgi:hypothetical protein
MEVRCPRINQIFFRFEPKQTETQSVSVLFQFVSRNQKTIFSVYFGLFRCFGSVSKQPKQTELCRNKPKQTETNQKISKKRSPWGSRNSKFFSRFEPKQTETQSVSVVIRFFFAKTKNFFFGLFQCFGPISKQPKQTELMVWGIKKVDILTNLLLFRLFRNTETPCFDIKAKQPKKTSCFG